MSTKFERYIPSAFISLVFLLTYLCLYFAAMPLFADPDTSWHLATGDLIIREGALPPTDPWSFASAGQPWYIISWFWDIVLAGINRLFGLSGVSVFAHGATAALAAFLAFSLTQRERVGSDALIFTLLIAGLCFLEFAQPRPQIIGYFCIVWTHLLLHQSRSDERSRRLWILPVLMVLWVNNHGSFLVGFTLLGAYGLEALIARRWTWFKHLFLIGMVCVPALLINPYGFHIYTAVRQTLNGVAEHFIVEWLPFVFGNSLGMSIWFLLFLVMGCVREPKVPLADKIVSLLWLLAMFFSTRNGAVFFLVSAPAVAISLQAFSEQLASIRTVRPDVLQGLNKPGQRVRMFAATAVIFLISATMLSTIRGNSAFVLESDPGPAVAWLKEHATGKRILVDYGYGGRVIYETRGAVPIFVDGRSGTAYSKEVITEYMTFLFLQKGWDVIIDKYHIDGIFVPNITLFAVAYSNGQYRDKWKEVYRDGEASIYMRKK
jgi:hypothetical protein